MTRSRSTIAASAASRRTPARSSCDPARASAHRRGYGRRWQRESKAFLEEHPLCALKHERCTTVARHVHHSTPHRGDMRIFWNKKIWVAACASCHSVETRHEQLELDPLRGVDASGSPNNPEHSWHK